MKKLLLFTISAFLLLSVGCNDKSDVKPVQEILYEVTCKSCMVFIDRMEPNREGLTKIFSVEVKDYWSLKEINKGAEQVTLRAVSSGVSGTQRTQLKITVNDGKSGYIAGVLDSEGENSLLLSLGLK